MATSTRRSPATPTPPPAPEFISGKRASELLNMNLFSFMRTALWHQIRVLAMPGQSIRYRLEDVLRVKEEFDQMKNRKA